VADNGELTRADAERMIDEERGTLFNWLELPNYLELKKGEVTEYPDRVWINEIIDMIKTDGQAAGVEQALTMPLRQANITIERPDKDRGGKITEAVEDALLRPATEGGMTTPFETVIGQMTFACAVARTFHELVWTRRDDGRLGFSKIAYRPPGSCEIVRDRESGELKGYKQFVDWDFQSRRRSDVDWRGYVTIEAPNAVIHINNQHRDPVYGWSDLSVCNWAFQLKRKVMLLWATLLTRVAEPWVLAYGANAGEAKKNAKQIAALRSGGVAAVERSGAEGDAGKMYDVMDVVGQGAALYLEFLRYLDGMMSSSVLGGWMDLAGAASQSGAGSYALSSDQSGLFLASRHGAARELTATINYQIIRPFVRVNFGPKAPVPLLKMEKIGSEQVSKAMEMLQVLGSAANLNAPSGFVDLLIERVSAYLDLPDDRVRKMIEENAKAQREAAMNQGVPVAAPGTEAGNLEDAVTGALATVTQAGPPQGGPAPTEEAA
jgi:uncharacterized protein DUF935